MRIALFLLGCGVAFIGGRNWLKATSIEDKYWGSTILAAGGLLSIFSVIV